MMARIRLGPVFVVVMALTVTSRGTASWAADSELGRKIYVQNCGACHGAVGEGAAWTHQGLDPAPFDFASPRGRALDRPRMLDSVSRGVPNTSMMGYAKRLKSDEIAAVIEYIRATMIVSQAQQVMNVPPASPSARIVAATPEATAQYPIGLRGDSGRGVDLYRRNCLACHGENGDGKGPRVRFVVKKPKSFSSLAALPAFGRPQIFDGVAHGVSGSEMPAWSAVLDRQQIADVAEYVFVNFVQAKLPEPAGSARAPATESQKRSAP